MGLGTMVAVAVAVLVGTAVALADGVAVAVPVGVGVAVRVGPAVGVAGIVGVGLPVGDVVWVGEAVAGGDAVALCAADRDGPGVTTGVVVGGRAVGLAVEDGGTGVGAARVAVGLAGAGDAPPGDAAEPPERITVEP